MTTPLLFAAAAFTDWLFSCLFLAVGLSLPVSQLLGFSAGALFYWVRVGRALQAPMRQRAYVATALALVIRGGLLALVWQRFGWLAPVALVPAAVVSVAVTQYVTKPGWRDAALALIAASFLLRLFYAGSIELMPEETYYWNYSRHLDIGYLDHPPMVAWLIRAGVSIFGDSAFGVRAAAIFSGVVASFFIYRLTRRVFGEPAAVNALLLAQVLPFFFIAGMVTTPDAPLVAAWAAALYFLERALIEGQSRAWWRAGVALGFGLISKYTILLVGAATALGMTLFEFARRWWLRYQPYAAALLALLVFAPVIIWNAEHDWASFTFQTTRRLAEAPRFSLHKLIASALVLITPVGLIAALPALWPRADGSRARKFLALTVLVPLALFTVYSLRHEVKLDWTGAPWVGMLPLLAADLVRSGAALPPLRAWLIRTWPPALAGTLLLLGAGLYYLALGLPGVPTRGPMELVPVGWRDLSRQTFAAADAYRNLNGERAVIVGLDRYAIASELSFYAREFRRADVEISSVHLFEGMGLMYERWTPAERFEHRSLLLLSTRESELSSPLIEAHTGALGPVQSFELARDGQVIRRVFYRFARDYHAVAASRPIT